MTVLVLDAAWIILFWLNRTHGLTWAAPALGLLVGTALPLQVVAVRITRSNRR